MDRISVLDSAYCPSVATSHTGSIKPSDSVSHISTARQNNSGLLSRRQRLEEPTVPASVRSLARGGSRAGSRVASVIGSYRNNSAQPRAASCHSSVSQIYKTSNSNVIATGDHTGTLQRQKLATSQSYRNRSIAGRSNAPVENFRPETAQTIRTSMSLSTSENVKILEQQIRKKLSGGRVYSLRALFKTNSTEILRGFEWEIQTKIF